MCICSSTSCVSTDYIILFMFDYATYMTFTEITIRKYYYVYPMRVHWGPLPSTERTNSASNLTYNHYNRFSPNGRRRYLSNTSIISRLHTLYHPNYIMYSIREPGCRKNFESKNIVTLNFVDNSTKIECPFHINVTLCTHIILCCI